MEERQGQSTLSPSQTAKGLRAFIWQAAFQGAWSKALGINTPVFTGYALLLGATQADIGFLVAFASLASLVQIASLQFTARIKRKKAFLIGCGCLEMLLRFSPILLPLFLPETFRIGGLYFLVISGLVFTHLRTPLLNDWLASTAPEGSRGRFISQRWISMILMTILAGFLYGGVLDFFPGDDQRTGFVWVFAIALVAGLGSYGALSRAPLPAAETDSGAGTLSSFGGVLRDGRFVRLVAFRGAAQFCTTLALPFYSVFMLQRLELSYTAIAIYSNLALVVILLSNRPIGGIVDRFGSKPVLRVFLMPGILAPLLWVVSPAAPAIIPLAMVLNGLVLVGVRVASVPLLWDSVPERGDRTSYFAVWSVTIHLSAAVGALAGALLVRRLGDRVITLGDAAFDSLQVVFLLTTVARLLPNLLAAWLEDKKAQTVFALISRLWKGNPLTYVFNAFLMNSFSGETVRARAASGLARSGSPMAVDDLISALDDISPAVRRKAAEGLGDLGAPDAAASLMVKMRDKDSDIRAEVTEALGKIQHPLSLDALISAVDDEDPRVRISAVRSLGDIGGDGVRDFLYGRLCSTSDRQTLPTLVDVLSRLGEPRLIPVAVRYQREYDSPVIRAQFLNAICRSLGAGETFYQIAILDELKQATRLESELKRAQSDLSVISTLLPNSPEAAHQALAEVLGCCEDGRYRDAYVGMVQVAERILDEARSLRAEGDGAEVLSVAVRAAEVPVEMAGEEPDDETVQREAIFAAVCLCRSIGALREAAEATESA